jgi:hypothetical protein
MKAVQMYLRRKLKHSYPLTGARQGEPAELWISLDENSINLFICFGFVFHIAPFLADANFRSEKWRHLYC